MHRNPTVKQDKRPKCNLMSLNSLVLGTALFPHCFNEECCGVQFFGIWGVLAPRHRVTRNRIQEASILSGSYTSQPVRNMTPQERLGAQKGAVEDSQM